MTSKRHAEWDFNPAEPHIQVTIRDKEATNELLSNVRNTTVKLLTFREQYLSYAVIEGTTLLIPREFRRSPLNPALSPFGYRAFSRNSDRFPKICAIVPRIASERPDQFSNVQGHKLRHTCGPNELLSNVRNTRVNSYLRVCEAKPRPSTTPCTKP